jgi:hypothetical protein
MRYVSLVFLVILMWWSWSAIRTPSLLPEGTHVGIQEDLRRLISEYITENLEGAKDIRFEKFWTQTLKENQIKAVFAYSFLDNSGSLESGARVGVEGFAILNRSDKENSEFDVWNLDELNVENNRVVFENGTTIQGSAQNALQQADPTPSNEPKTAPTENH